MTTLRGVLEFYSETGTEGGYWAFQDEKFMGLPVTNSYWTCTRCSRVWDKSRDTEEPKPDFTYRRPVLYRLEGNTWKPHRVADDATELPVPVGENERIDWYSFGYDHPMTFPILPDDREESEFLEALNAMALECYEKGHERWESPEERLPNGMWSYEGLHVLSNGDHLRVFDEDDRTKIVWDGEVRIDDAGLFKEDALGLWIHHIPRGVDKETWAEWFFAGLPAEWTEGEAIQAARRLSDDLNTKYKALPDASPYARVNVEVDGDLRLRVYNPDDLLDLPDKREGYVVSGWFSRAGDFIDA